jgi:hypothetical protein
VALCHRSRKKESRETLNRGAVGNFDTSGAYPAGWHWSSTQHSYFSASPRSHMEPDIVESCDCRGAHAPGNKQEDEGNDAPIGCQRILSKRSENTRDEESSALAAWVKAPMERRSVCRSASLSEVAVGIDDHVRVVQHKNIDRTARPRRHQRRVRRHNSLGIVQRRDVRFGLPRRPDGKIT